jgi:hypothetical protein
MCRLYPDAAQQQALAALLESHRCLYNGWLEKCRAAHEADQSPPSHKDCLAWFRRACRRHPDLAQLERHSAWAILRRAARADRLFRQRCQAGQRSRYPSLESRLSFTRLEFSDPDSIGLSGCQLEIAGVGVVRMQRPQPLPAAPVAVTLQRAEGNWYAVFHGRCGRPGVSPWRS